MKNYNLKLKTSFKFLVVAFSFALLAFSFNAAGAAELKLDSQIQDIAVGQQYQVDLVLDAENEEINAVEGQVVFQEDLLELKEIRDGNSIINFWVERPGTEQPGIISFSGITPGGFKAERGLIFSVIFQAKRSDQGVATLKDIRVLKNDGLGTTAEVKISNFQFLISEQVPISEFRPPKDIDLPESFVPEIARDPNIFDNQWFLVFATQDKGFGIDHYEVREGKRSFVIAESPYLLKNQNLDDAITVKAIDKSGNERVITLPPQKPKPLYKNYLLLIILITGVLVACIIWRFLWKKHEKQKF